MTAVDDCGAGRSVTASRPRQMGVTRSRYGGETTTTLAVPTTLSVLAATTTIPGAWAVTSPALLTEAIASLDDDQVKVLPGIPAPLEANALATNWTRSPIFRVSAP